MKYQSYNITSINGDQGKCINDLEAFILMMQKLIKNQQNEGHKGIRMFKGTPSETKLSYKKAHGILCTLATEYGLKGCFSLGICADCDNFTPESYSGGSYGKCKGTEKHAFDTCNKHSKITGVLGYEKANR